ncbi:LPD1 domain-containing protein [Ralstonia sp. ASV6]|uniref:LPD1 domain-containing protein n=1 Tax=Ralstonia sp. ASV6 TaxID=2795124 RepID=UPI0018EE0CDB
MLWPDLERFGGRLTVAFNPTVGRSFLKFALTNRELYSQHSGASGDLAVLMREAGFSLCASETRSNEERVYGEVLRDGGTVEAAEAARRKARQQVFFYSPVVPFNRERLRLFIPDLQITDMRSMPLSTIKHLDSVYVGEGVVAQFIEQQQNLRGSTRGIWYTTPADREFTAKLAQCAHTLNELLEYRDLPPAEALNLDFNGDYSEVLDFHPVVAVERAVRRQAIGVDGLPLRAPKMTAVVAGYATRDAAVAGNGGVDEGIEQLELPHGIPVAFTNPTGRLLILKDARYLEYGEHVRAELEAHTALNVQHHLDFLTNVSDVVAAYDAAKADGLLDQSLWTGAAIAAEVKARFEAMFGSMKAALAPLRPTEGFLSVEILAQFGSQRAARFNQFYSADFLSFLGEFRTELYNAAQRRDAELSAEAVFQDGMKKLMKAPFDAKVHPGTRREDAGEKIGGARKDFATRVLAVGELLTIGEAERVALVKKDHVWPKLDFDGMRAAGVEPAVAHVIRTIRDALPVTPFRGGRNRTKIFLDRRALEGLPLERCESFVRAISVVRDALANVKTESDLQLACIQIHRNGDLLNPDAFSSGSFKLYHAFGKWDPAHWFFDGAGQRFLEQVLPTVVEEPSGKLRCGDKLARLLAAAHIDTEGGWVWAIKSPVTVKETTTREKQTKQQKPTPRRAHLERIERKGPDYRGGADVDEKRFLATFGFRGLEYGNWLPQAERQAVLNHAYDAWMDLARVLDVPPTAVSLGGTLAIAFGARGSGGKDAAEAHFERPRKVMNLTRMHGAGSVAHEWAHALDDALAGVVGLSNTMYATELAQRVSSHRSKHGVRFPGIISDLTNIVRLSKTVPMSREEAVAANSTITLHKREVPLGEYMDMRLNEWAASLDWLLPEGKQNGAFKAKVLELIEEHRTVREDLAVLNIRPLADVAGLVEATRNALERFGGAAGIPARAEETLGRIFITSSLQRRMIDRLTLVREKYTPEEYRKNSTYFDDAIFFDSHRSKPYFSTDVELFARAFESWIQDRVEKDAGHRSDYLVYGTDVTQSEEVSGYPQGDERLTLNAAFGAYFDRYREELVSKFAFGAEASPSVVRAEVVGGP